MNYLQKQLGTLANNAAISEAKMLIFEAVNLGIMKSDKKDLTCVKEFARAYPDILRQVTQEHPEYFVDGSIVRACIKDHATLAHLLGENYAEHMVGQGNGDYISSSYWNEYSKVAMEELLKIRLKNEDLINKNNLSSQEDKDSLYLNKVKIVSLDEVWSDSSSMLEQIAKEVSNIIEGDKLLIPLNIYNRHWVGVVIDVEADSLKISYMDSEQQAAPNLLKDQLIQAIAAIHCPKQVSIEFEEIVVEMQQSNNCGSEVIENFMLYLTGHRFDQNEVVANHYILLEERLMSNYDDAAQISSTDLPLSTLIGDNPVQDDYELIMV